ncbi:MAG: hypothetical protein JNN24_05240 [Hyphomicrobium zavarzinii]|uniref:hypothetical protein n=1 Tax=Hyphomicrobium zavarzinii TaxID=48292 RepID=UPI001A63E066|nr:hypothetical protein [Hyphomicrobium zavarzinii]MBL8845155.1 hypothetical protein [Hyphomicrobium zavarzinii]
MLRRLGETLRLPAVPARRFLRRPGALTLAFLLLAGSYGIAAARSLSGDEVGSLKATVQRFDAAMRGSDYGVVVDTIPPRVLSHIAEQAGLERDKLRTLVIGMTKQALETVKLVSFGMDTSKLEEKQLADGTPFALIPTITVMDAGNGNISVNSHTLALIDGGAWYLLRVSEVQQIEILRKVYPEFAGVVFPTGSVEAMKD